MRSGRLSFSRITYDAPDDVLRARLSSADEVARERNEDGDWWGFDADGHPTSLTVMEPRERLERDGGVYVTLPTGERERLQGAEAAMRPLR